jgi:hypothetical protein
MFKLRKRQPEQEIVTIQKIVPTVNEILARKHRDCTELILKVNNEDFPELNHRVSSKTIEMEMLGSYKAFDWWINQIGKKHSLCIYSKESESEIRDFGRCNLIDATIEAPDNDRMKMTLIWGL